MIFPFAFVAGISKKPNHVTCACVPIEPVRADFVVSTFGNACSLVCGMRSMQTVVFRTLTMWL